MCTIKLPSMCFPFPIHCSAHAGAGDALFFQWATGQGEQCYKNSSSPLTIYCGIPVLLTHFYFTDQVLKIDLLPCIFLQQNVFVGTGWLAL